MNSHQDAVLSLRLEMNNSDEWKTIAWFPERAKPVRWAKRAALALDKLGSRARFRIVRLIDQSVVSEYEPRNGGWRDCEVPA